MGTVDRAKTALTRVWELNRNAVVTRHEWRRANSRPPQYWEGLPEQVFSSMAPGFCLSTGRCGTKLLTTVLDRVDGVVAHHAPAPELVWSERMAYEEGLEKFEEYRMAIRVARFELVADAYVRERQYVETNYRVTFYAPHLYDLFPRSRFVHLVRHPWSFIRSAVRFDYYGGMWSDIGRIRPVRGDAVALWSDWDPFMRAAWLWNETNAFIERFKQERDEGRLLTVKAEDLFSDGAAVASILTHFELTPPSDETLRRWTAKPVNTNPGGKVVAPHREWSEERKAALRPLLSSAKTYGYDL